jgi:hypothetical protein
MTVTRRNAPHHGTVCLQIYAELAGLSELRFHWRDKLPPYSVTTSLAGAMAHYPDRDLLLALYHVPQVRSLALG